MDFKSLELSKSILIFNEDVVYRYERFIATGGSQGVSLLDMDMTDISCRNHDVVEPQLIIWIDNFKEQN